jgi:uncharacterized protein YodC (DUF2158 family)
MSGAFRVGELVRLRSGGPTMTVVGLGAGTRPSMVECAWFDRHDAHAAAGFPPAALERVGASQAGARISPLSLSVGAQAQRP